MCGISGIFQPGGLPASILTARLDVMNRALHHRGPDAGGIWSDPHIAVGFSHRRLAVVDLTDTGAQPMHSADGRFVICYNGEIYNANRLRPELEAQGAVFRGTSDTEIMLEAFARWGVQATLPRLVGMFAIALWDRRARELWLIRDRMGIKPLFWRADDQGVLFGSELKSMVGIDDRAWRVDRDALAAYLRFAYVPSPLTVYEGVHKLDAGQWLRFSADGTRREGRFWTLEQVVRDGRSQRLDLPDAEAVDVLEDVLGTAVRDRMAADVPLGAFLSGGIDSSVVVALMQKASDRPVKTFTIGFDAHGFDEARHAGAVAAHLGTDHTELYVSADTARDVVPDLARMYDEPFADSSQIPTYLVSEMTKRQVTVALSGDGGDELFAGYTRHAMARIYRRRIAPWPPGLRRGLGRMIRGVSADRLTAWGRLLPRPVPQLGDRLHKLADGLAADEAGFYRRLVSQWADPQGIVLNAREPASRIEDPQVAVLVPDLVERLSYLDTVTYLPDDILTKVDRASMAVALEARVPILDHRVAALAWKLPLHQKLRHGTGKWILRQLLYRHVPRELADRPKTGFAVPLADWLRGGLKEWAEELLSERRLREDGLFDPVKIRALWAEHCSGKRNHQYALWTILMAQAWRETWL